MAQSQSPKVIDPEKLPRRLLRTYPLHGKVNSNSTPGFLIDLVDALHGTPDFDEIQSSCFGKLFRLPVRKCSLSGKIVHTLISRMLNTKRKHEMWYLFGGQPIRFSLREFAIITGLPCHPYSAEEKNRKADATPVPVKDKYWDTLIGKDKNPTCKDIVGWLKDEPEMPSWRRIRLALIVIVEGILNCGSEAGKPSKPIVEKLRNLESFLNYPWGRDCFERVLEMMKVGEKVKDTKTLITKLEKQTILLHGFPLVIQLLAFRAIPYLERKLPSAEDESNFTDRSIMQLLKLKTFHNPFMKEAEFSKESVVDSIIGTLEGEEEPDKELLEWDDELEDAELEYLDSLLEDGSVEFKPKHWLGGVKCKVIEKKSNLIGFMCI